VASIFLPGPVAVSLAIGKQFFFGDVSKGDLRAKSGAEWHGHQVARSCTTFRLRALQNLAWENCVNGLFRPFDFHFLPYRAFSSFFSLASWPAFSCFFLFFRYVFPSYVFLFLGFSFLAFLGPFPLSFLIFTIWDILCHWHGQGRKFSTGQTRHLR